MTSMICQSVAGTAFARIHVGAVQQMGGAAQARSVKRSAAGLGEGWELSTVTGFAHQVFFFFSFSRYG